ncbi:MAG: hypothetical protein HND48_25055 [Chloroflexi bacterium]|nr:hypothetical protein [Chloroflexota bacterium]
MIDLARNNLNDGGGQYVEETFYYAGLAREALGERDRAINNLREAVNFNPNFTAAREKLDQPRSSGAAPRRSTTRSRLESITPKQIASGVFLFMGPAGFRTCNQQVMKPRRSAVELWTRLQSGQRDSNP